MEEAVTPRGPILRGRYASEFSEFSRQMRLVRVTDRCGNIGQTRRVAGREALQNSRESLHAIIVLGRQPDRGTEQRNEMPGAVSRFPLNIRDSRGRPRGRTGSQSMSDGRVDQQRALHARAHLLLQHTEHGRRVCGRHQPLVKRPSASAPQRIEGHVPIRKLSYRETEDSTRRARAKGHTRDSTARLWTGHKIAPLRSMHNAPRPDQRIFGRGTRQASDRRFVQREDQLGVAGWQPVLAGSLGRVPLQPPKALNVGVEGRGWAVVNQAHRESLSDSRSFRLSVRPRRTIATQWREAAPSPSTGEGRGEGEARSAEWRASRLCSCDLSPPIPLPTRLQCVIFSLARALFLAVPHPEHDDPAVARDRFALPARRRASPRRLLFVFLPQEATQSRMSSPATTRPSRTDASASSVSLQRFSSSPSRAR